MAELTLYITESDELPIVTLALQLGCVLVPDLHYPTPRYDSLRILEDYKRYRLRTRLFYLLSEQFLRCPVEMSKVEKSGKLGYYIGNSGGPTIHFLGGGDFEEAGSKFIRPASIGYRAKFWNEVNKDMEKPPAELVKIYKTLQKLIRSSFLYAKPSKVSFWVGPEAVRMVQCGAKLVGFETFSNGEIAPLRM
jgi:hypothetical protein